MYFEFHMKDRNLEKRSKVRKWLKEATMVVNAELESRVRKQTRLWKKVIKTLRPDLL